MSDCWCDCRTSGSSLPCHACGDFQGVTHTPAAWLADIPSVIAPCDGLAGQYVLDHTSNLDPLSDGSYCTWAFLSDVAGYTNVEVFLSGPVPVFLGTATPQWTLTLAIDSRIQATWEGNPGTAGCSAPFALTLKTVWQWPPRYVQVCPSLSSYPQIVWPRIVTVSPQP